MKTIIVRLLLLLLLTPRLGLAQVVREETREFSDPVAETFIEERGLLALDQSLKELTAPFTVMALAANVAEVDFATLAYCRRKLGARTVIVCATRHESERQLAAVSFTNQAALLNTRKAVAAAHRVGADIYFLGLSDFGDSKSAEEALRIWKRHIALEKMVKAIRLLRPDVLLMANAPSPINGQQKALAQIAFEAFEVSADRERFSQAGLDPWQAQLFFQESQTTAADVSVPINEFDAARGHSYAEIGRQAARLAGAQDRQVSDHTLYQLARSFGEKSLPTAATFLDGVSLPNRLQTSLSLPRAGLLTPQQALTKPELLIAALKEKLLEKRTEAAAQDLQEKYGEQAFRILRFIETLDRALALLLGFEFDIQLDDRTVIRGQTLQAQLRLQNRSRDPVPAVFYKPDGLALAGRRVEFIITSPVEAPAYRAISETLKLEVPSDAPLPSLNERFATEDYYPASLMRARQLDHVPGHQLEALAEAKLGDTTLVLRAVAFYDVAADLEILTPPFFVLPKQTAPRNSTVEIVVRNRTKAAFSCALWVVPLVVTEEEYEPLHLSFTREDEEVGVRLKLRLPILQPPLNPDILIEIRREKPAPPDPIAAVKIPLHVTELEPLDGQIVGLLNADEWLPFALNQLGATNETVSPPHQTYEHGSQSLASAPTTSACKVYEKYDAILIGESTGKGLNISDSLKGCLLDYVQRGGKLIVLFQQAEDWNAAGQSLAPFSIRMSNHHLTAENSRVKILAAEHPLLNLPNRIVAADFENWSQDRARHLPTEWAGDYTPLLEAADPGEEPSQGLLLTAKFGEGVFVFTSLDFGKQVMAANPGAYRLLSNLLHNARPRRVGQNK